MRSDKELSELMERGINMEGVHDNYRHFLVWDEQIKRYHACALGAAIVGLYGDPEIAHQAVVDHLPRVPADIASELLDIEPEFAKTIEREHRKYDSVKVICWLLSGATHSDFVRLFPSVFEPDY